MLRRVFETAIREFRATALTKAFIFGTFVLPVVIWGVLGAAGAAGLFNPTPAPLAGSVTVRLVAASAGDANGDADGDADGGDEGGGEGEGDAAVGDATFTYVDEGFPPRLSALELCGGGVTDVGVRRLRALTCLKHLNLSQNASISDRGAAQLHALHELEWVGLVGCGVSREAAQRLRECLPRLHRLNV